MDRERLEILLQMKLKAELDSFRELADVISLYRMEKEGRAA